jgi:hypothetical protein
MAITRCCGDYNPEITHTTWDEYGSKRRRVYEYRCIACGYCWTEYDKWQDI